MLFSILICPFCVTEVAESCVKQNNFCSRCDVKFWTGGLEGLYRIHGFLLILKDIVIIVSENLSL